MKQRVKSIFEDAMQKEIRSANEVSEGFSNETYEINNAYVLRLTKDNEDETINRSHEKAIYDAIAPLNISETVLYFNEKTGSKISKLVHSSHLYVDTPTDEQIIYVAKTVKKLHNSKIQVPFGYQMFLKLNKYKEAIDKNFYLDEKIESKIVKNVQKIFAKDKLVLCHNDLVRNNLLFKYNKVTIIDWEYAGMNNPYFDLASFISENDLTEEQEDLFLSTYFGAKYNTMKKRKVHTFMNFLDVLFYYWGLYLYKKRGDTVYKKIASHKQKRIKSLDL